ncbi:MAG TPA: AIM24 family protein [Rhizobiales bacterium]|nr:AIM24 family protein [Hyphomicrobiales bacterium]
MGFIENMTDGGFAHERRVDHAYDLSFDLRGAIAPFLEVTLANGEGLICDRSCVLQHDFGLTIKRWPGLGGSRWLVVNSGDEEEASVMLTAAEPGVIGSFELSDYGGRLICLADSLMANGPGGKASYYARFEEMGLALVMLEGNGWAFLRSRGDVFEYRMAPGEKICMRARNVAAMTATVNFEPVAGICQTPVGQGEPEFVSLTGPGTIWMQSISQPSESKLPRRREPGHSDALEMRTGGLAFLNGTSA